jgi:signal transduction histidine kinase/CheY-like chemotaxis protein
MNEVIQKLNSCPGKPHSEAKNMPETTADELAAALRESRQKLEFAIQGGGLGLWEWNPQTGSVNYDKSWVEMIDFEPDAVPPYFEFFKTRLHPEDAAKVLNRFVDLLEGRSATYESEHRMRTRSDQWRWFLNRGKITEWDTAGHPVRVTGVVFDITKRKLADDIQKQRLNVLTSPLKSPPELRLEDLFDLQEIQKIQDAFADATGVASIITDPQGTPITRPSNFCNLCQNIIRKAPKGKLNCQHSDAVLGRLNPSGPVIQRCLSGGLLDGGSSIRAGDQHIANWLIGQVLDQSYDEEKMIAYAKEIGADESEFRNALKQVVRMPKEKFEKVGNALFLIAGHLSRMALQNIQQARYITEKENAEAALQQAKEAAEAATRAKDQFLAVLSHELRTPLTPVLATVSILKTHSNLPDAVRMDMELIQRNVEMEATLIDDLLDITRISRGKIDLRPETVDIHVCLKSALEICGSEIAAKGQKIECDFQAAPHHVWADPARLRQVFWNLLSNAIKFTPERGHISLRTFNRGAVIQIEFADSGIGINADAMPRIFNPFEQGEQSKSRKFGGLGLGLNIAKTVVELHQGRIIAFSEGSGKGAVFTVELAAIAPRGKAEAPPCASDGKERSLKILLVEDHPDTMQVMTKLLEKSGHQVIQAESVMKAKELESIETFDLLISDLGLPDGSGLDIMRQAKGHRGIPGIALSGFGTEEDIRQSREAGFEEHLVKPINFKALLQTIRKVAFI